MPEETILYEFKVRITCPSDWTDSKQQAWAERVNDALDDIQFNQIIRQKFEQHGIEGVGIEVVE